MYTNLNASRLDSKTCPRVLLWLFGRKNFIGGKKEEGATMAPAGTQLCDSVYWANFPEFG
jgi:hypothetical protein